MQNNRRCVITGIGPVTPIGIGKEAFWSSLVRGTTNYSEITRFPLYDFDRTRIAGQIKDFDPALYVSREIIKIITRICPVNGGLSIYYGIAGAKLAVQDSGLQLTQIDPERSGTIIGTGSGDLALLQRGKTEFGRQSFSLGNAISGLVSKEFGFHGLSIGVAAACATGNLAMRAGYLEICNGTHDVMVVGSSDAPIDVPHYMGSEERRKHGISGFSQRNDLKRGMLPFDRDRDGIIVSEGAGVMVLEEMNHALVRNAKIYAELRGYGESTYFEGSAIHVTKNGYLSAMTKALKRANVGDSELADVYVNAHGTATELNDSAESMAVFDLVANKPHTISSFKGTIGHSQAASAGIELVGCTLVIDKGVIPKTNLENIAPDCAPLDYVTKARERKVNFLIKNAAGFNGVYSTILLQKFSA